jgi:hypothetical protein
LGGVPGVTGAFGEDVEVADVAAAPSDGAVGGDAFSLGAGAWLVDVLLVEDLGGGVRVGEVLGAEPAVDQLFAEKIP